MLSLFSCFILCNLIFCPYRSLWTALLMFWGLLCCVTLEEMLPSLPPLTLCRPDPAHHSSIIIMCQVCAKCLTRDGLFNLGGILMMELWLLFHVTNQKQKTKKQMPEVIQLTSRSAESQTQVSMTPKLQVLCTTIYPLLETPASLSHDIILQVCCYQFLKPLSFLLYLHYFFSILKSTFHCVYIYIYIHTHTVDPWTMWVWTA